MLSKSPGGLIAVSVVLAFISASCVCARFVSRRIKDARYAADDWLILSALAVGTGLAVMEIYGAAVSALGVPLNATLQDASAVGDRLNTSKHIEYAYLYLGTLGIGLVKLSVCCLLRRIFITRIFKTLITIWIVIVALWILAFILAILLECGTHVLAPFGTPQDYLDYCGSSISIGWALVGSDVATDFITLLFPIVVIWSLQMSLSRKILSIANLLIGLLSLAAGIVRAYMYIAASKGIYTKDAITLITSITIWNFIEVHIGIIAACGPALRPVITNIHPSASLTRLIDSVKRRGSDDSNAPSSNMAVRTGSYDSSLHIYVEKETTVQPAQVISRGLGPTNREAYEASRYQSAVVEHV